MIQSKQSLNTSCYINNKPAFLVRCPKCDSGFYCAEYDKEQQRDCKKCDTTFYFLIKMPIKDVVIEVSL